MTRTALDASAQSSKSLLMQGFPPPGQTFFSSLKTSMKSVFPGFIMPLMCQSMWPQFDVQVNVTASSLLTVVFAGPVRLATKTKNM